MPRILLTTALAIAVLALVMSCSEDEPTEALTEAPYFESLDAAQAAVAGTDKEIVIKFYTDWCKWCTTLDTVVLVDSAAIEFFQDEMALVKINAEEDTVMAERYSVRGFPTLVMVDQEGIEIDRLVGYLPTGEFLQTFRDYREGIGTLDDLLHRADTAATPDRELYMEIADKYKYRGEGKEALNWFQKVIDEGEPLDSLTGEARLALADALRSAEQYDQSVKAFEDIARDFKSGSIAEDAEIWVGVVHRQKGDTAKAVACFQAFIEKYPESEAVEYCEGQIKKLTAAPEPEEADSGH